MSVPQMPSDERELLVFPLGLKNFHITLPKDSRLGVKPLPRPHKIDALLSLLRAPRRRMQRAIPATM